MNGHILCENKSIEEIIIMIKYSLYDKSLQGGDIEKFQQELVPAVEDVNWFNDAFNKIGSNENIGEMVFDQIQGASENLKVKREQIENNFKTASSADDAIAMMDRLRQISDYSFQSALMAKVISKSTQAMEKLTNLQ